MIEAIEPAVVIAVAAAVAIFAAYGACEAWLRTWEQQLPSPLERTLARAGVDPERLALPVIARELRAAERQCPVCPATSACRQWLESGSPQVERSFCPNAELVERLTR